MRTLIMILCAVSLAVSGGAGVYAVENTRVNSLQAQVDAFKKADAMQAATNARDVAAIRKALETIR